MLEGLKVIELATFVAAPGACGILADWGASVVKLEGATGDPARYFFPDPKQNPSFALDNRGKRSVVLNIAKPEGRDVLMRLLADADVFVTNLRPGALKRAGIEFAELSKAFPRLVYCSISGYGLEGAAADFPAYDMTAMWTRGGLAAAHTPVDQELLLPPGGFGDHICAISAVAGILAALQERQRTDRGRLVEASLLRTGIYVGGFDIASQLMLGQVRPQQRRDKRPTPLMGYFPTSDGRQIFVFGLRPQDWPVIAGVIGRPELTQDPRFATPEGREENAAVLLGILDEGFFRLTLQEAGEKLSVGDVAWAPMQTAAEVVNDPYAIAAGCFVETPDGGGGAIRAPAGPIRFPGADDGPKGPPPGLGQHTREVLGEVGYTDGEIERLIEGSVAA